MRIELEKSVVRSWQLTDAVALQKYANNRNVWINLRDSFPHPYRLEDGRRWLVLCAKENPALNFAVEVDGEAVGGIGLTPGDDVDRVSAEIGYWLAEPLWGRGIMTEVVVAMTRWAIDTFGLTRVFALPFDRNGASARVLEKAGYQLEGRLHHAAIKDGVIVDVLVYAFYA